MGMNDNEPNIVGEPLTPEQVAALPFQPMRGPSFVSVSATAEGFEVLVSGQPALALTNVEARLLATKLSQAIE